ncbi:MarR family transcriptional regulator [Microbacteriaceae bacterium VKM Ac-2855]|nr:MarR family transcriptional regulator [Microbacteriaceae bacterium VKM Ac-2855]
MARPELTIDDQICFALYSASRALTSRYREFLAPLGVTYPQYLVLLVLWEDEPLTVSALGERLHLDSGTVSPLLRRLEASGLVTRRRLPNDERSVEVRLTPEGRALQPQAEGIPAQVCAATGLELPDIIALRDQIALLAEHVRGSSETAA